MIGLLLLGYTRVILAGLALHYMSYHPIYCTLLYSVSCLLDAVDGQAARALGQTSKFGAVLDMVTDRCVLPAKSQSVALTARQLYYVLLVVLPFVRISHLCPFLPVPYRPRLQQPLHAYVQVCVLNLPGREVETDDAVQFTRNGVHKSQAGNERRQQDSLDVL